MNPVEITQNTLIVLNLGTILAAGGVYTRLVYSFAKLDLMQQFQKEQLNSAFQKIRDLEKRLNDMTDGTKN